MKWMEMIHVRSSAAGIEESMPTITMQVREIANEKEALQVFVLKHALYDGDLAVILVWNNKSLPEKTREGLMLAERLHRLGPIDHAVWRAAPGFEAEVQRAVPQEPSAEGSRK